jgi:DUF1365 family protein
MESRIYTGKLTHMRQTPVRHAFSHRTYLFGIDVATLEQLDEQLYPLFGHNRGHAFSVHDRDHLGWHHAPLDAKLRRLLAALSPSLEVDRVYMLAMPRLFVSTFNPISLFFCLDRNNQIAAVVAEVRNTYHEKYRYVTELTSRDPACGNEGLRFRFDKQLFASPFNGVEGQYEFEIKEFGQNVDMTVTLVCAEMAIVTTSLKLRGVPLSRRSLAVTLLQYPLCAAMTLPRIVYQALVLRFIKGLPARMKPRPPPSSAGLAPFSDSTQAVHDAESGPTDSVAPDPR